MSKAHLDAASGLEVGMAAAAAAIAAKRQAEEEEEEMTPYSAKELAEGWEFKVLRNATGRFSDFSG